RGPAAQDGAREHLPAGENRRRADQLLPDREPHRAARAGPAVAGGQGRRGAAALPHRAQDPGLVGGQGAGGGRSHRRPPGADADQAGGAARIAARSAGGDLLAVHVTKSDGLTGADPAALASQRRLAESVGGTYHQVVGDNIPESLLTFARAENATQLVLGASRRSWLTAMLTGPGIGSRTIRGSGDIDVHIVTHAQMGRGRGLPRPRGAITLRRQVAGYVLAAVLPTLMTLVLTNLDNSLNLTSDVLLFLVVVVVVALTG